MDFTATLTQQDWSLHRKGPQDQARHDQKVKEAIKDNLGEIIAEEAIITSDGRTKVKVPIRSLKLPRFRFGDPGDMAGQGSGNSKKGDVLGQEQEGSGPGKGKGAGNQPGIDYYEAEITIDELAELLFVDLGLPNLREKPKARNVKTDTIKFDEIRRKGIMPNLHRRETALANIRRNAMAGNPVFGGLTEEDMRFRSWRPDQRPITSAVVIAMRDISGSMGEFQKYISRSFFFWMVRFLRTKYTDVEIVFIVHHTEAKEVDERAFFTLGESGGTNCSSAYNLALEIIMERYDPESWNIYPFHFSDGDNWESDNPRCLELVGMMLEICNLFGYGEINERLIGPIFSNSTLMKVYSKITDPRLVSVVITSKDHVYPALKRFFGQKEKTAA